MVPLKEEAPGGRHTTRSGASSRWRVGKLRFGAATVRRPVPRLSPRPASPPRGRPGLHRGIGCVQRPRSRRGLRRTRHRARLGFRLRPPRRFGLGPAPLRGRPLREPRLGLPPASGSGSLRLRPLSLADSHVNTFGGKPQVPSLAEPHGIGRKTPKNGPFGAVAARIGRKSTPVGPIPLPRWAGQLPRWAGQLPRWAGQLPAGPGNSPDRTTTTGTARDQIRRLVAPSRSPADGHVNQSSGGARKRRARKKSH